MACKLNSLFINKSFSHKLRNFDWQIDKLNEVFFFHIVNQKPFVHLKAAISIDGKICTKTGDSKWITNEESRTESHLLRMTYDAVLIGRNTLNEDNCIS